MLISSVPLPLTTTFFRIRCMKLIRLSRSAELVANYDEWQEFQKHHVGIEDLATSLEAIFSDNKEKSSELSRKASTAGKLRRMFDERVLSNLRRGEWTAYGHSIPRKPNDEPVKVPIDVWLNHPKVSWDRETVRGQGLEFINVSITKSYPGQPDSLGIPEPTEEPPKQNKVGRPPMRPFILEAYATLKAEGEIDFTKPKSALYDPICNLLARKYPDRASEFKGLDDSTIRKAITEMFNEDR